MRLLYGFCLISLAACLIPTKCTGQIAKSILKDEIQIARIDDNNWRFKQDTTEEPKAIFDKPIKSNYRIDPAIDKLLSDVFGDKDTSPRSTQNRNGNADDFIDQIFLTTKPPIIEQKRKACTDTDKICIPYILCKDNNTSDEPLIDLHYDYDAENCPDVCCQNFIERSQLVIEEPKVPCGFGDSIYQYDESDNGESQFGEFPWMVALLQKTISPVDNQNSDQLTFICGGSIISSNLVLTAAHCVHALRPELLVARAGEWDTRITKQLNLVQDVQVEKIIIHENFNNASLFNDIALLRLATPYKWMKNVRPICLPTKGFTFASSTRCYATGWGKNLFNDAQRYSVILKKVGLPIVSHETCEAKLRVTRLGMHFNLHESFLCAGGEKGKDTCKGDGGSPLVCPHPADPKRYYQAGIVAWGIGCGSEDIPATYANVTYFADWLEKTLLAISDTV